MTRDDVIDILIEREEELWGYHDTYKVLRYGYKHKCYEDKTDYELIKELIDLGMNEYCEDCKHEDDCKRRKKLNDTITAKIVLKYKCWEENKK